MPAATRPPPRPGGRKRRGGAQRAQVAVRRNRARPASPSGMPLPASLALGEPRAGREKRRQIPSNSRDPRTTMSRSTGYTALELYSVATPRHSPYLRLSGYGFTYCFIACPVSARCRGAVCAGHGGGAQLGMLRLSRVAAGVALGGLADRSHLLLFAPLRLTARASRSRVHERVHCFRYAFTSRTAARYPVRGRAEGERPRRRRRATSHTLCAAEPARRGSRITWASAGAAAVPLSAASA